MRYDSMTDVIGETPLVRIAPEITGLRNIEVHAKLEMLNPFGSVKDRAAWNMARTGLPRAMARGDMVVELSSGNTAKALAIIAAMHGLPFRSVTNRMKVPEIKDLLLLLGAGIEELPGQTECLDPTNTEDPLTRMYRTLAGSEGGYLHTDQYYNQANRQAHITGTGPEILKDLGGVAPDYFIAAVGTAGSSTGVATVLRQARPDIRVVGLVAAKSDFIPGIRTVDELGEVGLFAPEAFDALEAVTAQEAIDGSLTLIRRCGMLAGPTGGAAYYGAVRHLRAIDETLTEGKTAVFIVCDRVESYMSYFKKRRPELFNLPPRSTSVDTLTDEEIAATATVAVHEAQHWIAEHRPLIIDLRSPFAYRAQHIEGSVNIVDELFEELLHGGLPVDTRQPVLLACPVGEKSVKYAAMMAKLGHPDARSLEGGILAWRDSGRTLVRD